MHHGILWWLIRSRVLNIAGTCCSLTILVSAFLVMEHLAVYSKSDVSGKSRKGSCLVARLQGKEPWWVEGVVARHARMKVL